MRKLGLVVVLLLGAVSVAAAADDAKKKEAPPPQPKAGEGAKAMRPPDPPPPQPVPQPAPEMPKAPPKPGPEQAAITSLGLNWNCDGTMKDPATGADVAYKSTWKGKWDLNKLWIAIEYKQTVKKPPMKFTGKGFIGWSPSSKVYMFNGFDDWGGHISLTATGWDADGKVLAFTGEAGGPMGKAPMRITFTKGETEKQMSWKLEVQPPGAKDWMLAQSETCKR
jgi:hypothetical protein